MSIKKIMLVFGTRPEAIKMAPLFHELIKYPKTFETLICVTAQHRALLDQVLDIFEINPDFDLNVMTPNQDLSELTSSILLKMKAVLLAEKPDIILVHGDTTTTFATALAAFYIGIPIGHIEAGMRTGNISNPFPEEFNRQIVGRIAKWHFAPTDKCKNNLLLEKTPDRDILVTGNTVVDSLFWVLNRLNESHNLLHNISSQLTNILKFNWREERFVLVTGHRRENFGLGLKNVCMAIRESAIMYPHVHFVYPAHLNPNVQKAVNEIVGSSPNIHICSPMGYEMFVLLMKHSFFVITDSGGIQEEAPSLGKPVLVTREVTERPEAVEVGTVKLVGTNQKKITSKIIELLNDNTIYQEMSKAHNPYGDGYASSRIVGKLKEF